MKKVLSTLLALALLLGLCACGQEEAKEAPAKAVWHGTMPKTHPLGVDGKINGLAVLGDRVFIGGEADGGAKLLTFNFSLGDAAAELSGRTEAELPDNAGTATLTALSCGAGKVYAMFCPISDDETASSSCTVAIYNGDGVLERTLPLTCPENAAPGGMLAVGNDNLCIWWAHRICLFSMEGELLCNIIEDSHDIITPMLIADEVIVQLHAGQTEDVGLARIVPSDNMLIPVESKEEHLISTSRCQSADGKTYLNCGGYLSVIDDKFDVTPLFNWYELTCQYGNDFKYICPLDEHNLLIVPRDSGTLISMHLFSTVPTRSIRIAFAGYSEFQMNRYELLFRHYATDYNVECVRFGIEPGDDMRLAAELGAGSDIDLLICDMPRVDPYTGFVDLYPLLDADEELKREDFPEKILKGLERNGALYEIWGNFTIDTWRVKGILAHEPEPLTLWGCKNFLDSQDYQEPFFNSYETKERMLSDLSYAILTSAYDDISDSYVLDTPYIRELLEFCNSRPAEDPYKILDGDANAVDPSLWYSDIVTYVVIGDLIRIADRGSENRWENIRFFDGQNGGDNLSCIGGGSMSCYLIPKTCADIENAWGFLRILLKSDWQTAFYELSEIGLPLNIEAYNNIVGTLSSPETQAILDNLLENSPVFTYEYLELSDILVSSMLPWFNGNATLDDALAAAQGRINIYTAERAD